jgi:hypothetical protein
VGISETANIALEAFLMIGCVRKSSRNKVKPVEDRLIYQLSVCSSSYVKL